MLRMTILSVPPFEKGGTGGICSYDVGSKGKSP
jgi:hypothetical protein